MKVPFVLHIIPLISLALAEEEDALKAGAAEEAGAPPPPPPPPPLLAPGEGQINGLRGDEIVGKMMRNITRHVNVLTTLGFLPGVTHESPEVLEAADVLDAVRQADPDPKDELPEVRGWRLAERKRRIKAALRIDGPRGLLFGPRGGQVTYLSPLVSDLLQARINRLRATLPCPFQEERIAQELGLLNPGESIAEAMERANR